MIRYALVCADDHEFEAWFGDSADFDAQSARGLVECPHCGTAEVAKAPMAPAIARRRTAEGDPAATMDKLAAAVRRHVRENFDYVGEGFAKEVRAMREGDAEDRPIWGEASRSEAEALVDEGHPVAPLPAPFAPTPPRKLN